MIQSTYNLFHHLIFTLNLLGFLAIVIIFIGKRSFPDNPRQQKTFYHLSFVILFFKIVYVTYFYIFLFPDWVINEDALDYYNHINLIADDPYIFNHNFDIKKLGMQAIYGSILYIHRINGIYGILSLNIFFSFFTCLITFFMTRLLTDEPFPALFAFVLMAFYPEAFFWNGRVLRENLSILLVPCMVYGFMQLYDKGSLKYLLFTLIVASILFWVRLQLILFAPLIIIFYTLAQSRRHPMRALVILLTFIAAFIGLFFLFNTVNSWLLDAFVLRYFDWYMASPSAFFGLVFGNLGQVLSVAATGRVGALGILLAPFTLTVGFLFFMSIVRAKVIFKKNPTHLYLLTFLILSFLFMLALSGYFNIRFRSNISGLILPIICVSAHYYWKKLNFPRIVIFRSDNTVSR